MRIVYEPLSTETNKYSEIVSESLAAQGIECISLKDALSSLKAFQSVQVFHLNWYESLNGGSPFTFWKDYFKRLFLIQALKLSSKHIIWTMHNRRPHEKHLEFLRKGLFNELVRKSDCIVTHSKVSSEILADQYGARIKDKVAYIPHPNYIDLYGPSEPKPAPRSTSEPLNLIFIGALKPYKNIELLIEAVNALRDQDIRLNIYGKVYGDGYEDTLRALCLDNPNIQLHPQFVADEDIPELLSQNDALVCPYDTESSLNSGSVILAFSYRTTVICPTIGTVSDFGDDSNMLTYDYHDRASHLAALTAQIRRAAEYKQADRHAFVKMGEQMYRQMQNRYSREAVAGKLNQLYRSMI